MAFERTDREICLPDHGLRLLSLVGRSRGDGRAMARFQAARLERAYNSVRNRRFLRFLSPKRGSAFISPPTTYKPPGMWVVLTLALTDTCLTSR